MGTDEVGTEVGELLLAVQFASAVEPASELGKSVGQSTHDMFIAGLKKPVPHVTQKPASLTPAPAAQCDMQPRSMSVEP